MNGTLTIPAELRDRPQWVCWRREMDETRGDWTKRPYQAKRPNKWASSTDPATWADIDTAIAAVTEHGHDGIGFVFTADDPYVGIDLDKCIDPRTGRIEEWAAGWALRFQTFTEYSPSGTGMHLIARGELPAKGRKHAGIEVYDQGRFFTVTGHPVAGMPDTVEHRQDVLEELLAEHFPAERAKPAEPPAQPANDIPTDDADLLQLARGAANGQKFRLLYDHGDTSDHGGDDSAADMALCVMLAFWTGRDTARIDRLFRASGLMRDKWDRSVGGDTKYGAQTIARAIEACDDTYTPTRARADDQAHDATTKTPSPRRVPWVSLTDAAAQIAGTPGPDLLTNQAGQGVLYRGKRHLFAGEPETLKTLCLQIACRQILEDGGTVVWFDYDAMGGDELHQRMRDLGATDTDMERFKYIVPEGPIDQDGPDWFEPYRDLDPDLVVIDAYDPALTHHGYNPNAGSEVEAFNQRHINPFHKAGAAVVILDHLTRNPENRGMYSAGSFRKTAAIDVSIRSEHVSAARLHRGGQGKIRLRVMKDRPGHLHRGPGGAAVIDFQSGANGAITWDIEFTDTAAPQEVTRRTAIMENASRTLEREGRPLGKNELLRGTGSKKRWAQDAIETLIEEGHIRIEEGPKKSKVHHLVKPYRQNQDPKSDQYREPGPTGSHRVPHGSQDPVDKWVPGSLGLRRPGSRDPVQAQMPVTTNEHRDPHSDLDLAQRVIAERFGITTDPDDDWRVG